ncbi:hypothetical protein [Sphaerotilus mobilis]|uniref:Galactose mutarotase-like enzyme n=1 Tax=Sphaerotilus mobilis TaxID=47994 RepID=A0A4Q7LA28_9BURK|nr:hypothetical protein [Sphaerotilus mobilis]RZS46886.1 hypothetical protein EV685_3918 [Sphaerotilus mobilis]
MNRNDTLTLRWPHGQAHWQSLGGMLGPVTFEAPGHAPFQPLQVAPWADEPGADALPGIVRRLRGEWPCVPFGRTDRVDGLPPGWTPRAPGDDWGHGYASHHDWTPVELAEPTALRQTIELPASQPIERLTRTLRADPAAPTLHLDLAMQARAACTLPVSLHPTLRLDLGRVAFDIRHAGPALSYPVPAEPSSRLRPDARFDRLSDAPAADGSRIDLARMPQPVDSEELLQLMAVDGPVRAHYLDAGWTVELDWDHTLLPDLMVWVSHRGRPQPPWNSRHWAIGLEPVGGVFDLGRVATPPADHPLASRTGLSFGAGQTLHLASRISAWPMTPAERARWA